MERKMGLLDGKVAIVTGAGQGIGAAIAERLAGEGAAVAVLDINLELAQGVAQRIKEKGVDAEAYKVDVSNTEDAKNVVAEVVKRFGRSDILVNNAGVTRDGLLLTMSEKDWDTVIDINLKGIFNFTKAVYRQMIRQKSGAIVNIASVVGLMGNAGQVNYAASKAGAIGVTKASAKELASRNIRVNAVAPGFIQTAMTDALDEGAKKMLIDHIPAKKLGSPEDVANAVLFLASDLAGYITGEVVRVDGGMAM
jgi:3-oxoacyl-[acyl-carrier protein] reductase